MPVERRFFGGDVVLRIEGRVAEEVEHAAGDLIRARLERDAHGAGRRPAVFGRIAIGDDLEFRDRDRRLGDAGNRRVALIYDHTLDDGGVGLLSRRWGDSSGERGSNDSREHTKTGPRT